MPLLWLSLAFLAGDVLAAVLRLPLYVWALSTAIALAALLLRRILQRLSARFAATIHLPPIPAIPIPAALRSPVPMYGLLLALTLGGLRYQAAQPWINAGFIASYNDQPGQIYIEGVISEPPDQRDQYINLRLKTERLRPQDRLYFTRVHGLLLVQAPASGDWHYGDRVRVLGSLVTPPEQEDFSYRDYLALKGIYSYLRNGQIELLAHNQGNPLLAALYRFKARGLATIYRLYPDPEASLLAGILLGVARDIPASVQDAFRNTGTAHIIAISGFNITILAALITAIFARLLGRWRGAIVAAILIGFYTILVGAGAAVVRAAIMGVLAIFASQLGRRQAGLNSLAITAALMALLDPQVLWDVSFQLSFAATLGLIIYSHPFTNAFASLAGRWLPASVVQRVASLVGEYFLFTLAAQLTTLPITAYHFGRLSVSALLANPLILPVQPAVEIAGGLAVLLGIVWLPLGQAAAYLAWPFVVYTIRMVEWLGAFPGGVFVLGKTGLLWVALYYAGLFAISISFRHLRAWLGKIHPATVLIAVAILTVLVWRVALDKPDGRLHLMMLDVGSGDALLIQSPTGRYILVNGGPNTTMLSDALGRRLPITHRRLDWLVVASTGDSQLNALPRSLDRYPADRILWAGATQNTSAARALQQVFDAKHIVPTSALAGQALDLGNGAQLKVLATDARGAVLLLEWKQFRALLPMGADYATLERVMKDANLPRMSVLMLAESGYAPLNTPVWIERWGPKTLLLSVAAGDPYGLPSAETLAAAQGYTLLRTDRQGWIDVSTDGNKMWVEVEHK